MTGGTAQQTVENVQLVLQNIKKSYPSKVVLIPETKRLYLKAKPGELPENLVEQLQIAFIKDMASYCKYYGGKYLLDWKLLLSKSARETYWGASYLCNRTFNYFGIRRTHKPWACQSFGFCQSLVRNDPDPAPFIVFENFEQSLWMFIHTIYSDHYLIRYPDRGSAVFQMITYERTVGQQYWRRTTDGSYYTHQLAGRPYPTEVVINTWSGHESFNLCVNCSPATDKVWIKKIEQTIQLMR